MLCGGVGAASSAQPAAVPAILASLAGVQKRSRALASSGGDKHSVPSLVLKC